MMLFQLEIPLTKVVSLTRERLALIIPNGIGIQTADHKVTDRSVSFDVRVGMVVAVVVSAVFCAPVYGNHSNPFP